jgi:hypothetical protein
MSKNKSTSIINLSKMLLVKMLLVNMMMGIKEKKVYGKKILAVNSNF